MATNTATTGRTFFQDAAPNAAFPDPHSLAAMALAAHPAMHKDGPFSIFEVLPAGFNYTIAEHDGTIFLMRRDAKAAAKTGDAVGESDRLRAIQAANRAFYDRPSTAPRRA